MTHFFLRMVQSVFCQMCICYLFMKQEKQRMNNYRGNFIFYRNNNLKCLKETHFRKMISKLGGRRGGGSKMCPKTFHVLYGLHQTKDVKPLRKRVKTIPLSHLERSCYYDHKTNDDFWSCLLLLSGMTFWYPNLWGPRHPCNIIRLGHHHILPNSQARS